MSHDYRQVQSKLKAEPRVWLITGVAGFIGSNLMESLLNLGQTVVGLDNFRTGYAHNLEHVLSRVDGETQSRFKFIEGDITNLDDCRKSVVGVDYVLHQAGLGSVPLSVEDPIQANRVNVDGFLNMAVAARNAEVKRFVYATSSAVYGDDPQLPKVEAVIGQALSPYSINKYINELYANIFFKLYGLECIGLRYFNIFGPRQDPDGAYSAVIPKWFASLLRHEPIYINGDGETSRDFCYVDDVVQANILAACTDNQEAIAQVYNIGCGKGTSLNQLFNLIQSEVLSVTPDAAPTTPIYREFREGDIRHSIANITKAQELLGYQPDFSIQDGLNKAVAWYLRACFQSQ